ncbi:DMT family transporter [Pontibacillus litoralis]|uniref:Multidrug resistance protein SMR n=1 Tax=Pontibacillus litoralis JSM 072002 TaxID=1385512 RepID=A0A0A5G787_9BACI|nr:SMR family transporter [Pontibacillus litoralis]KGX87003.1 multidrug resistance protein SMR [Pontibacillus litoralis JSM 072002]
MGWILVACASICEILGVLGLRLYSQNKTIANGALYLGGLGAAFAFLYASFSHLLVSISYSVFVGVGTAGAVIMNMLFFGESTNKYRIVSLILIIIGVTGLKSLS